MAERPVRAHSWLMERRYFSLVIVSVLVMLSATVSYICYRHHLINTEQALKDYRSTANLLFLVMGEHLKQIVSVMESHANRPLLLQAVRDKNAEKAETHLINLKKGNLALTS